MITSDLAAQAVQQVQARLLPEVPPITPPTTPPVPPLATPAAQMQAPVIVTADPLAALLQSGLADVPDTPLPAADMARRYAENTTPTQRAATDVLLKAPSSSLGPSDTSLLSNLSQAYRQTATATPLPQLPNIPRELANAQLPNAPATAGNAPAVIVVDGRALPLNATQTALVRGALASNGAPDTKLLASLFTPLTAQDPDAIPLPQPASALRELAGAAVAQPANAERSQTNLSLPSPRQQPVLPLPLTGRDVPNTTLPATAREVAIPQLTIPAVAPTATPAAAPGPAAPQVAAAIIIDGRTIPLNPAQVALVRANLDAAFRRAGPGIGGSDGEDPTIMATDATAEEVVHKPGKIQSVDASPRVQIESRERHASPAQGEGVNLSAAFGNSEEVEAVHAIRHEHPAPYEPQVILPRPQDQVMIAPGPDRVILAGQQATEAGPQSAITGIALALAPGITRDDVTAEFHQDGYRLTFSGSEDSLLLHASAGLSAQLMFADGTSMRLQLSHE